MTEPITDENLAPGAENDFSAAVADLYNEDGSFKGEETPDSSPEPTPIDEPAPDPAPDPTPDPDPDPDPTPDPAPDPTPDPSGTPKPKLSTDDAFDAETLKMIGEMAGDPKANLKFASLRQELKAEREAKADLTSTAMNSEEVQQFKLRAEKADALEVEVAEMRNRLGVVDFQSTPQYQEEIVKPMEDIHKLSESIGSSNEVPDGEIFSAISTTDQKSQNESIERIAAEYGLNARHVNQLYNAADDFLRLSVSRDTLHSSASERMTHLREMQVSESTAAQTAEQDRVRTGVDSAFARYEGTLPGFVTEDGKPTDTWNSIKETSRAVSLDSVEDKAHAIFAANILPSVLEENSSLMTKNAEQSALLARLTKSAPTKEVGTPASAPASSDDDDFMTRYRNANFE